MSVSTTNSNVLFSQASNFGIYVGEKIKRRLCVGFKLHIAHNKLLSTNIPGVWTFTTVLLPRLKVRQVFLSLLCLSPDPPVQEAHDCNRNVESCDGSSERDVMICYYELNVALVVRNCAVALNIGPCVNPRWP